MDIKNVTIHRTNYSTSKSNKKGVVMHWMAGRMAGATARFQQPNQLASAHYGIANNEVVRWVKDNEIAYHTGVSKANIDYIGIEHEGGWLLGDNTRQKPSRGTHDTSAHLLANLSSKYGWGKLEYKKNVFKHSDFKATQCCGSLDVDYIINRANELINQSNNKPMKFEGENYITRLCENYEILLSYPGLFLSHKYKYVDGDFNWNGGEQGGFRNFVKWWAENRSKEEFKEAIEADYQTWLKLQ
jgi:hypothetical protein